MLVNHSGWNETQGFFSYDIFIDEKREDYEIHFANGDVLIQQTPFDYVTGDWNHDEDVYTQFGAWFREEGSSYNRFWTPEDMVMALTNGREEGCFHDKYTVVDIPGISLPTKKDRTSLEEKIKEIEKRNLSREPEQSPKKDDPKFCDKIDLRAR